MNYIRTAKPRLPVAIIVKVGDVENEAVFDAQIDSKEEYGADTPNYPVERDFDTTTSTINKQVQLTLNLFLTPYPVTWAHFFGRSIEMVKETLIRMYWLHYPVTVRTQDDTYENMAIKSLTFKRNEDTGEAYEVNIVFVHVQPTAYKIVQFTSEDETNSGTTDEISEGGKALDVEVSDEEWEDPLKYVIF